MPKSGVIAALVAALALGTVMGAFAQKPSTETVAVETATIVEVAVWQRASDGALYLSTRPEGGGWTTHDTALAMRDRGRFRLSNFVSIPVPATSELPARWAFPAELDECTRDVHQIGHDEVVLGDGRTRYRLGADARFVFTVPEGVTVRRPDPPEDDIPPLPAGESPTFKLRVSLGIGEGSITFGEYGAEVHRNIAISLLGSDRYPLDPHALADQLVGSVRSTPGWQRHPACDDE